MSDFLEIIKNFFDRHKYEILLGVALIVSIFLLLKSCSNNVNLNHQYNNNINALTEQVEIWKTKSGDLVAEKTILEGDLKLLKKTNEELYDQVQKLKVKPKEVVYVETVIEHEVHDTTFIVPPDSSYVKYDFDFSDKWRTLTGYAEYDRNLLNVGITKDIVNANFTLAIKDSKVYVTSDNPYINYTNIQGITLPNKKPVWSIGIGPSVNFGYDVINKKPGVMVGLGISLNYNLINIK